jgi:predicted MFS family arabinose efflux permease
MTPQEIPPITGPSSTLGLGVLTAATFIGVTTELLPIGLLPAISADLSTSEAATGMAVTGYALVVALSATPLTAATAHWPRRRLLLAVLTVLAASNAVAAAAPTFAVLLMARVLGGLCHGVFWSMVAGYAARLVAPDRVGRATSAVFTGNALAVAVGLPVATVAGDALGWRVTFLGAAALTATIAVLARFLLAPMPARPAILTPAATTTDEPPAGSVRSALAQPGVRAVAAITALLVLGHYILFSYISVYLRDVDASSAAISAALLLYGVAGVGGTVVLGRAYDRRPAASFAVVTATLLGALATLAVLGLVHSASWVIVAVIATTAVLGGAAISFPVALQAMVLTHAGPAPDAASSLFVAAFNLGISGGALAGALLLATTSSVTLPVAAVLVATAGALLAARTAPFRARTTAPVRSPVSSLGSGGPRL